MSDDNKNTIGKEDTGLKTDEPNWVNIDLGPRNIDPDPQRAQVAVIDQVPRWTELDLEAGTPPRKPLPRFGTKSKIIVGIALLAMVVTGICVPMVVAIRHDGAI